jgi:APA family basic amino acid/polyamine antiporter
VALPRVMSRLDAVAVVVGSIIGSGIFLKPGVAAASLPYFGPIICVWIGMGLVTLFGSLALAELAAMLPHAGGPYVYLREAYGRLPAFLWGWTEFWIIRTGSLGALACATAIYLDRVVDLGRQGEELLALAIVVGLSGANMVGTRWGAGLQTATAAIKSLFLLGVIVLPFALRRTSSEMLAPMWPETANADLLRGIGAAMIAVLWPYDGWINIGPVAEEIRQPQRNVPLALAVGMGIVISLYVLANVSYHATLPMQSVRGSDAVASDLLATLLPGLGGTIAAIGVACSTFGAVNSNLLTGPRIYFAMARDGLLPSAIRRVHPRFRTPFNAILLQCVWSVILIRTAYALKDRPIEVFDTLTNFVVFGGSLFYALAVAAVFVLRRRRPDLDRPYRTWGYPWTPALYLLMFVAAMAYMFYGQPLESSAGMSLIAGGVAYYAVARRKAGQQP